MLLVLAILGFVHGLQDLLQKMQDSVKDAESELRHLKEEDYHHEVAKRQAKVMFDFMDQNKDNKLSKDELEAFGKLSTPNDTKHTSGWADENFKNDKDKDSHLSFEEFFQPTFHWPGQENPPSFRHDEF